MAKRCVYGWLGDSTAWLVVWGLGMVLLMTGGCKPSGETVYSVPEGRYLLRANGEKHKLQMYSRNDTSFAFEKGMPTALAVIIDSLPILRLMRRSLDVDVFTSPFKFRAAQAGVPAQVNTTFNGALFVGHRWDTYGWDDEVVAPGFTRKHTHRSVFSVGGFVGMGSVFMNPAFLQNAIDYEYDAFVTQYGVAGIVGGRNVTTGVAVGADMLLNQHRRSWIYQHKPWVGIFVGINLN